VSIANKQVPTATIHHATIVVVLEAVFSVVRAATVATQRRGKLISAAAVELQQ
jgi:hypothetical protein